MKPIEKPNLSWQYDVNKTVHELIDAVNELLNPEERQLYHCPVCGEKGEKLIERVRHNTLFFRDVVFDTQRIYTCPKCHCLFWEEV